MAIAIEERARQRHLEVPEVVIVGAGFAGLYAARQLRDAPVHVTLIDRHNHHLFQPLLYQVATAGLSAPDIAAPIRSILRRQHNVTILMGDVKDFALDDKVVVLQEDELSYDYLLVATGAQTHYFGNEEWEAVAPGLKTLEDALDIRRRILLAFEHAERHPEDADEWLTFVVIGGGPTGVELAGALAEIARYTMADEFTRIDTRDATVTLLEAADEILPGFPDSLAASSRRHLERMGVEVRTGDLVTDISETGVQLGDEHIGARTVLWAAGVRPSPLGRALTSELTDDGRVLVNRDLNVPGHPNVFVAGDLAAVRYGDGWVPGIAPAAIQQGRHSADNIRRLIDGNPMQKFSYRDKGMLATIGRKAAIADFGWLKLDGFVAWILWIFVHIFFLIGFRNRVAVMFEWAWAYVTFRRSARVVLWGEGSPRSTVVSDQAKRRQIEP